MNATNLTISLLIVAFALSGCNERRIAQLENQVEFLSRRLDSLSTEHEALTSELENIKSDQSFEDLIRRLDEVAYLTPGEEGYSAIRTNLGSITVSLKDVRPYANGSRVTLQFGNTLSATILGLKAKIEWGSVDSKGSPKLESQRNKEISLTKNLASGTWTNVSVVLDGIPPSELGFVRVKEVYHTGIRLLLE